MALESRSISMAPGAGTAVAMRAIERGSQPRDDNNNVRERRTKMETVYRYFAAMYASRAVPQFVKECRFVVVKMTGNAYIPNPNPVLTLVTSHIDTLEAKEQAAHHGPKGSIAIRNDALLVVRGDMRQLKSCVQ